MRRRYWCPLLVILFFYYVWNIDDEDDDYDGDYTAKSHNLTRSRYQKSVLNLSRLRGIETRIYSLSEFDLARDDAAIPPLKVNSTSSNLDDLNDLDTDESVYTDSVLKPPEVERWQTVSNEEVYVFSAHRDPRHPSRSIVLVFGILLTGFLKDKGDIRLYCHLVTGEFGIADTVLGTIQTLAVRKYKYEGFVLHCRFDSGVYVTNDVHVSVVMGAWHEPINALRVHDNLQPPGRPLNFTLCCVDILNDYTDYGRLVEWLELNLILGVQKFLIYVASTDETLKAILTLYEREGSIEIVRLLEVDAYERDEPGEPVHLLGLDPDVWHSMSLVSLQECLLRNMLLTKYLMFSGVDEIIAPRDPELHSLHDVVNLSKCANNGYISVLNFYFDPDWPDDDSYAEDELVGSRIRPVTLLKTRRERTFWSFENRSRYIVQPEFVDHVKPHRVWLRHPGTDFPCVIHPDLGALHHYDTQPRGRLPPTGSEKLQDDETVLDRSLHKYGGLLVERILARNDQLGNGNFGQQRTSSDQNKTV
ncbi:hypothetical protein LSH36_797g01026 [Paralvinella palmiformis]|uniref:Glycosyltransferase family 92 protein n=1 Tax=Paralvinella palmiformis TaxID=53620 RepID=A0AAD9J079_9ANNE|nr:hypothetical protein LSH36_797g01026 [Paralvinella palmiformis]